MVADATLEAAGAQAVGDRRLGALDEPASRLFVSRVLSHLSFRSVWFRNAVRGAAGLALAVAVVEVTDVEHGFWVVLGTLSVLRSNALGTGATALRAVAGTAVGFVVGSAIMIGVGAHTVALWVTAARGRAGLGHGPVDDLLRRRTGRLHRGGGHPVQHHRSDRLEGRSDPDRGCGHRVRSEHRGGAAVLAPGSHRGPRSGPVRCLRRQLRLPGRRRGAADRHQPGVGHQPSQRASHRAYLRLDDAFRQFLAERGAKVVPVETVAKLFTGSNRIRLAAFTLSELPTCPPAPGQPELESVSHRRRGPAGLVRLQPSLVRGVRRAADRPASRPRPSPTPRTDLGRRAPEGL